MTTDLNTEPTIRHRNRTVEMVWDAGAGTDHYGAPCQDVVTLTSMHHERKFFFAHLRREQIIDGGVRSFSIYDYVSVLQEPVARFSQKALDAFAVGALAALRDMADDEKVQAVLNPTTENV